ncbi:hypothetical protein SAMN05660845_1177 [Flavobacterium swingsii]|jgi:hypothetical protein|uniref:Por secretion system C-terminal sorting domain-containing protein n=1 Tax=Flavobacterium swingsii TaxID=498292 RepID=A0A1I0XF66_9FLAO|nr:hypothetical protein [Flavobacterium swingsii]SFA98908.1 hypothetical protein SAMN05660845_1177 [Flavobacterium swingsii]
MKSIYFLLLLSLNSIANTTDKEIAANVKPNNTIEVFCNEPAPKSNYIAGLKIINNASQKHGKLIYIVSDIYTAKKVSFFNKKGKEVFTTSTIGSPIYLSKFKKGTYTIKIVEDGKTEIKALSIN